MEIGRRLADANPNFGLVFTNPWLSTFDRMVRARRFLAGGFGLFGGLAVTLAAVGVYGVLAHAVSHRMREFGVRIALGASGRDVMRLVLHDGAVMALAGTAIGAFFAMAGARLLESWLYNVPATDVWALVAAEITLVATVTLACISPAVRAARADPLDVLRAT